VGGRSRVAAQMLAGKGFENVYNLTGGFKGWKSEAAFGQEDLGIELFAGVESAEQALVVAYSLEDGLRDFYVSMIPEVANNAAKNLFQKLSEIEIKHQDRILNEYATITGEPVTREKFEKNILPEIVEGGLTTREYIDLFEPDMESAADIVELAMSIEAQALDLYMRAAEKSSTPQSKNVLIQIAEEEREHMAQLGKLMERI
jgi:rubrerythrin